MYIYIYVSDVNAKGIIIVRQQGAFMLRVLDAIYT